MKLFVTPVPKPRMTQKDRWAKRPAVVRYYAFCDELRVAWGNDTLEKPPGALSTTFPVPARLRLIFGIPMPQSWSKRKKALMVGVAHQSRPDVDNLAKAFLDALCEDDSYVWDLHASKVWSDVPYIEIEPLQ
jgi:Holliday junction resolvase RusA-like endonuclease